MKNFLTFILVIFMTIGASAQDSGKSQCLLFEFMHVQSDKGADYWQVEDFWSGIHKQRIADKSIIGWDLWSLIPSGTEQGSQYLAVTVFSSVNDMLMALTSLDAMAYAKKAYPNKSEKELLASFDKTGKSRDIAHQVLLKNVDMTNDKFEMKVGTILTMDIMKQLEEGYEKAESEIFKPWHQKMVDDGKKGHWELLQVILPAGNEAYGTHVTISMYNDVNQLTDIMDGAAGEMDLMTQLAVKEGLKTRDWKEMKIAKLEKMIR